MLATSLLVPATGAADEITLTTSAASGATKQLALNAGLTATLTWDGGASEQITFDGLAKDIAVQGSVLKITTTGSADLTSLYCPDWDLTAIAFGSARGLKSVDVSFNNLTALSFTGTNFPYLVELNCRNNALTSLVVSPLTRLEVLDCSNNQLSTLDVQWDVAMKSLNAAGNSLSAITTTRMTNLRTLWLQNNAFTTLTINRSTLSDLYLFGNQLATLNLSALGSARNVWVDNNKLTTIDLSTAKNLVTFSGSDNELSSVKLTSDMASTLRRFYAANNNLAFNSFPTVGLSATNVYVKSILSPQNPIEVPATISNTDTLRLSGYGALNGYSQNPIPVYAFYKVSDNTKLVLRTDYTTAGGAGNYLFQKTTEPIYGTITSSRYPGVTIYTSNFSVEDPTAISSARSSAKGFTIATAKGQLSITTAEAASVNIVNTAGVIVAGGRIDAGTTTWLLPAGVYIVGDKKVLVP